MKRFSVSKKKKMLHEIVGRSRENNSFILYFYTFATTNFQKASLWQKIITSIKQYGKTEIKNIMKNTYAAFLLYEISKAQ